MDNHRGLLILFRLLSTPKSGFTLLELIVVIAIMGILATVAVPAYNRMRESSLGEEAVANLRLIAAAERIYRMETSGFYPLLGAAEDDAGNINDNLKLLLTAANWDYSITTTGNPADTFTAYADRKGSGGYLDCIYTLAYDDDEPDPNARCP